MVNIITKIEARRGCGYRKPGGFYLVCDGAGRHCGRLPIPLTVCPCCHEGIKPARGWTWIDSAPFLSANPCKGEANCALCPLGAADMGKVGLLWVGEMFYPTAEAFSREASQMGISRRLSQIPKGFKIGATWVWLAHRKAIPSWSDEQDWTPGVFRVFRPERLEYVVRNSDSEEHLKRLEERGITLVRVIPDCGEQQELDGESDVC